MHEVILNQRRSAAMQRIIERSEAIAEALGIDEEYLARVKPATAIKDSSVVDLMQLEGLSAMLIQVGEKVKAKKMPKSEDSVVNEYIAPVEPTDQPVEPVVEEPAPKPKATKKTGLKKTKATAKRS